MSLDWSGFAQAVWAAVDAGIKAATAGIYALGSALQAVFADPAVQGLFALMVTVTVFGALFARALGVNPFDWVRQVFTGIGGLFGRIFGGLF